MLVIEKSLTEWAKDSYYSFIITTDEGKFEIVFAGNLDLYWSYMYQGSLLDAPESKSFTITKENYYLFSLIDQLYEDIKNCNLFEVDEYDIARCKNIEEIENQYIEKVKLNNQFRKQQDIKPDRLFRNGTIEWHCDDFPYDESGIVKIEKEEDVFRLTFSKNKQFSHTAFLHIRLDLAIVEVDILHSIGFL